MKIIECVPNFSEGRDKSKITTIKNSISRVEACLQFVFSFSEIDRIIIGIDGTSQLVEISSFFKPIYLDCPKNLSSNDQQLIDPNNWKI